MVLLGGTKFKEWRNYFIYIKSWFRPQIVEFMVACNTIKFTACNCLVYWYNVTLSSSDSITGEEYLSSKAHHLLVIICDQVPVIKVRF